ncbi:MAG: SUMF1/EgtB/PvdO family nonheme iron enzyme [Rhodocyclaceae bacterium]|jgi:iron(II)-dependent oxidoreductase|nr:Hercynine oxygenase [Rhodocyclaceae bacterium]MBZ0142619.1 SUMF1/EgtB/PvdO family nonheme iron enzyme [Rhodocyclaceae bacterium]MCC6878966.1 ergothioneine biosynthesis protein EgtB [Rhodocyclaceae bacterium]MCL4681666.1 SUMF1/EgtB/PvdO family nonheme iron enzyme [Rhodocyclaceae bacterium]
MNEAVSLPAPAVLDEWVREARARTLQLVADLDDEQMSVPLAESVNPFLWELGHVAFFYDVFLLRPLGAPAFLLPDAEHLYNSFTVDHDDRWGLPLPPRGATLDYMQRVFEATRDRLGRGALDARKAYLYRLAVMHEDMHGEAFTYMRQTLEYPAPPPLAAPPRAGALPGDAAIPGGVFQLGAATDAPFVFDNEKWAHPVEVPPFRIARAPVTNAEYAAFVEAGGYLERNLWSRQGWLWRSRTGAAHPLYWTRADGGWQRRHFDTLVPLEPHAPVAHVGFWEAEAFCAWAGRRLPSEAEWEMAASAEPAPGGISAGKRRYPWGDAPPVAEHANLDARFSGCADVAAFPAGDSAFGCRQMLGNVWEWTASPFYPYPGYVVDAPYREYSAPWFGCRMVLKGGAWATRSRLITNTYRNFFLPARRDIFAGFRTCAR